MADNDGNHVGESTKRCVRTSLPHSVASCSSSITVSSLTNSPRLSNSHCVKACPARSRTVSSNPESYVRSTLGRSARSRFGGARLATIVTISQRSGLTILSPCQKPAEPLLRILRRRSASIQANPGRKKVSELRRHNALHDLLHESEPRLPLAIDSTRISAAVVC